MHSSTSNSDRFGPTPAGPWGRTWILTLALVAVAVSGLEGYWRSRGHKASVVDDPELWASHRQRVYNAGRRAVVLVGSSRMQVDFNTYAFRRQYRRYDLVQLAIDGRHAAATLRDLAQDERFRGIAVCDITEPGFRRDTRDDQQEYVDYFHNRRNLAKQLDRYFSTTVQRRLVLANPYLNLKRLLVYVHDYGILPAPTAIITYKDRSRVADYKKVNIKRAARQRAEQARRALPRLQMTPEQWLAEAMELEPFVQRIQDRGGKVVFVRMPTAGLVWDIDKTVYPREKYWDQLAARTKATCIHFQDVPGMMNVRVPDLSHVEGRDTGPFTRALAGELVRCGVIESPVRLAAQQRGDKASLAETPASAAR